MVQIKGQTILAFTLAHTLAVSLIASLFIKEPWLWMDEVLSNLFISDMSVWPINDAIVSDMDGNPPLSENGYGLIKHTVSSEPQFLWTVSSCLFLIPIAPLYVYSISVVGMLLPIYCLVLIGFAFHQSQKIVIFPSGVVLYLDQSEIGPRKLSPDG